MTKAYWPHGKPEKASAVAGTPRDPTDTERRDKSAHAKDDPSKDKDTQDMIDTLAAHAIDTLAAHAHAVISGSNGAAGATARASAGVGGK